MMNTAIEKQFSSLHGLIKLGEYQCDGGSICIGSKAFRANFLNGYGDGSFSVYLSDERPDTDEWEFVGSVEGYDITILRYDCYHREDFIELGEDAVLSRLCGRYGVYHNDGDILFVLWDEEVNDGK